MTKDFDDLKKDQQKRFEELCRYGGDAAHFTPSGEPFIK